MGQPLYLDVNGRKVLTTETTYDDLIVLYNDYINKYGKVPTFSECTSKNNLPQGRIVNKILKANNVTYKEFLLKFGKVSHVRTEIKDDYDVYLEKFKSVCKSIGRTLILDDFMNNRYGLPNPTWFVKHCPDENVKTYRDFVSWCGLEETKHIWTKDEVSSALRRLEEKLNRPIISDDVIPDNVGFSTIVVDRLYGSFSKAKQEIGLLKTLPNQPLPFSYYKNSLKEIVLDYKRKTNKEYISWNDIESGKYGTRKIEHKTCMKSFQREKVDLQLFIRSLGCMMNPHSFAYTCIFEDGERSCSNMEYKVTTYLRDLGLKYDVDYFRTVLYSTFSNEKSKMNCDYVIKTEDGTLYIEVAGIIDNRHNDWKTRTYSTKIENEYRDKMILKEKIFTKNNLNYIFLFSNDMNTECYKDIILSALNSLGNSKIVKEIA